MEMETLVKPPGWRQWLEHPERLWLRKTMFQTHLWIGAAIGLYVGLMSVTGSIIVFGNNLPGWFPVRWLVNLHENLLSGEFGRLINGIGSICVTFVCLTGAIVWWPGIKSWRRALTITLRSRFARLNWDAHSALGFWCFFFVLMWGISGIYFSFPDAFNGVAALFDPHDRFADGIFSVLASLHFGRFGWFTKALWSVIGLVPAVLSFTGIFLCCHRLVDHARVRHRDPGGLPSISFQKVFGPGR